MAISRVESNTPNIKTRLYAVAGIGAVAGSAASLSSKAWLYKGMPNDSFVKQVGINLDKKLTPKEQSESRLINNFLNSVVDAEVDVQTLKPHIRASKELSAAIKSYPEENLEEAISRVFAEPDETKLRDNLSLLQEKTKSDKKSGRNTALKLIHENFDSENKVLKKSEGTSAEIFNMLKSTAKKMQLNKIVFGGAVAAGIVTASAIVFTDILSPHPNKKA